MHIGNKEDLVINVAFSIGIFILGFIFLERPKFKKRRFYIEWDKKIFPGLKDEKIPLKADKLVFIICEITSVLILINGFLTYFIGVENISSILIVIIFLAWPIRLFYIYYLMKKN